MVCIVSQLMDGTEDLLMDLVAACGRMKGAVVPGFALLIGMSSTSSLYAQSLDDALVQTYLNNPRLDSGRAELRATDELVPQARAGWLPTLFLNGQVEQVATETESNTFNDTDTDERLASSIALTLNQSIYAGGGIGASVERSENLVRSQQAQLIALEQNVLFDAVEAYTSTWQDRSVLDLSLNNEERLERQLQATRDRFEVGEVARTDVAQAEARLSRARADVEQAKADLADSSATFEQVIGEVPGELVEPRVLSTLPPNKASAQEIASTNPNIIASNFSLSAARDNIDVAFADLLPSLTLQGELSYQDEPSSSIDNQQTASIGLNLSIPLYQGGAAYARVRENKQTADQARHDLEDVMREVQQTVESTWETLQAASAAIESFRDEVRANQIALEGVQEEALVGQRTVLDVLDAEQELFESQVNLVRAQRAEILASYQLKAATGQLTVADIGLPVQAYDPEIYYEITRRRLFGIDTTLPAEAGPEPLGVASSQSAG